MFSAKTGNNTQFPYWKKSIIVSCSSYRIWCGVKKLAQEWNAFLSLQFLPDRNFD